MTGRRATILVVEDEPDVRETLIALLERRGYATRHAGDGLEALDVLAAFTPDLILCDRMMPRCSGFVLLETIRRDRPDLDQVPFIFLTALADARDRAATADLRPTAYLPKPVSSSELARVIGQALDAVGSSAAAAPAS